MGNWNSIDGASIAGVQTPNCIRATAFDAVAHDYKSVTVLSDASGAANEAIHSGEPLDIHSLHAYLDPYNNEYSNNSCLAST